MKFELDGVSRNIQLFAQAESPQDIFDSIPTEDDTSISGSGETLDDLVITDENFTPSLDEVLSDIDGVKQINSTHKYWAIDQTSGLEIYEQIDEQSDIVCITKELTPEQRLYITENLNLNPRYKSALYSLPTLTPVPSTPSPILSPPLVASTSSLVPPPATFPNTISSKFEPFSNKFLSLDQMKFKNDQNLRFDHLQYGMNTLGNTVTKGFFLFPYVVESAKMVCTGCPGIPNPICLPPEHIRSSEELESQIQGFSPISSNFASKYTLSSLVSNSKMNLFFSYKSNADREMKANRYQMIHEDNVPYENIFPWSSCNKRIGCNPLFFTKWQEYVPTIHTIRGYPLTIISYLFCAHGGIITFITSGQIPDEVSDNSSPDVSNGYLTLEQLEQFGFYMGATDEERKANLKELNRILEKHDINTPERVAGFMGQVKKESDGGRITIEAYNTVLKNSDGDPIGWDRQVLGENEAPISVTPEQWFNFVYGDKGDKILGNKGSKPSGDYDGNDGERYRGAGYIQLTGRYNYTKFSEYIGDPTIVDNGYKSVGGTYNRPLSEIPKGAYGHIDIGKYAWESAGWFWGEYRGKSSNIDADNKDWNAITDKVNPGTDNESRQQRIDYSNEFYDIVSN